MRHRSGFRWGCISRSGRLKEELQNNYFSDGRKKLDRPGFFKATSAMQTGHRKCTLGLKVWDTLQRSTQNLRRICWDGCDTVAFSRVFYSVRRPLWPGLACFALLSHSFTSQFCQFLSSLIWHFNITLVLIWLYKSQSLVQSSDLTDGLVSCMLYEIDTIKFIRRGSGTGHL